MGQLKDRICTDFLAAFKAGQKELKNTLGMLKSLITETEKHPDNVGKELTDAQVLAVVQGYDKNLDKSLTAVHENAGGDAFAIATLAEKGFIKPYLPTQMSDEDIETALTVILNLVTIDKSNKNKVIGLLMGQFKSLHGGQYNPARLKELVDTRLNEIFA
jgi:uncharacterized protein YqeY